MAPVQERPVRVTRQRVAEVNQMSTHSLNVSTQPSSSAIIILFPLVTFVDICSPSLEMWVGTPLRAWNS